MPVQLNDKIAYAGRVYSGTITVDLTGATLETGETTPGNGFTVWYSFIAAANGSVTVEALPPTALTWARVAVYSGPSGATAFTQLTHLATISSATSVTVVGGTVYYLQVDGSVAANGYRLTTLGDPIDPCAGAVATPLEPTSIAAGAGRDRAGFTTRVSGPKWSKTGRSR